MLNGILIYATDHPYYGRMAYNLALTIRATGDTTPIAVAYRGSALNHLSKSQMEAFDHVIVIANDLPRGSGIKLWSNLHSPFKNTLVLDADMLWLPKKTPEMLFAELAGVEVFTAITEGRYNIDSKKTDSNPKYFFWANPEEIAKVYKIESGNIYQWRTEVMYFTDKSKRMFSKARKIFSSPNLTTIQHYAGGVADELAINVSAASLGIEPHAFRWAPSYWSRLHNHRIPEVPALSDYYLVSFGANFASSELKKLYDRLVKASCYKMGLQHLFTLQSKKDHLPERAKM